MCLVNKLSWDFGPLDYLFFDNRNCIFKNTENVNYIDKCVFTMGPGPAYQVLVVPKKKAFFSLNFMFKTECDLA